ncbi:MAG TPA: trypsin-like peptidase domain-containing protein [Vicinamibacterales bacterium]|nr:trypsin-like peptidase domain-containing protein [Vicinamibacterales bacterium]
MLRAWMLAALLLTAGVAPGQTPGVLRVTVTLPDPTQTPVPIARHALLISDNPPTREPRRVVTAADGTVLVNLAPGSYTVESDRPVGFLGQAYQWTTFVDIVAGRDTTLALTAQNAEVLAMTAAAPDTGAAAPDPDPLSRVGKWQASLVTVWSPTSLASGFVVDARGLVATDRNGVGSAASVEVQLSPTVKVPARVLVAEVAQDVAIVWVDPSVLDTVLPLPLVCPPAPAPPLEDGDEIQTIATSPRGTGDVVRGEITGFHPRGIETDLRLSLGETGGPVFAGDDATVVGLTSMRADADARRGDVLVVRAGIVCEAVSAARSKMPGVQPPEPTPLPVEPTRAYPTDASPTSPQSTSSATAPPVVSSSDFDVAFITPRAVLRARERADWTGGRSVRAPEAEARLGRLTDFGSWTEYFADLPAVLIVRVTPKLVEGFWKRLAREAARTQGAVLPAFKDFKTNFVRLRASCGGVDVAPIHPFVLEHAVDDKRLIREGLYVFDPDALGPHCGSVTLTLSSEQASEKADTLAIDPKVIDQIWQDFAPYRATGR